MKQTHPKAKGDNAEKQLEAKAVWSHLTPHQQQQALQTIGLVCQALVEQLGKTEANNERS